jgi:hypothetical protein
MIKRITAAVFLIITPLLLFAQYKNNKWLWGYYGTPTLPSGGSKMIFNNNTRTISYDPRNLWINGTFSGLSDKDESWFIYSNGAAICNKNHDTLVNGGGLGPGADPISIEGLKGFAQVVFFPGDTINQRHYLFHQNTNLFIPNHPSGNQPSSFQLYYSIIDPLAVNGRGEIISKNNLIINDTIENGNVLAVRHSNGRDWWVVVKKFFVGKFYAILVTPDSVYAPISYTDLSPLGVVGGQACFSPNGNHYASFSSISQLRIYDFNRCTGILYNYRGKFITGNLAGFTSFSPNSRFLYISSMDTLWQFDMQAPDVTASQTFIAKYDGFTDTILGTSTIFWSHWLAPDGKIYILSNQLSRKLHVINNPDMPGQACNFQQHAVDLLTYIQGYTCPTPINLALYQQPGSPCDTLGVGNSKMQITNSALKITPNPSDGIFSIEYIPQRISGMLYIYDIAGKEVYKENVSPFSSIKNLNLSRLLNNGIYAVCLVFGNTRLMSKIIIEDF